MEIEPIAGPEEEPLEPTPAPPLWTGGDIGTAVLTTLAYLIGAAVVGGIAIAISRSTGAKGRTTLEVLIVHGAVSLAFLGSTWTMLRHKRYSLARIGMGPVEPRLLATWAWWGLLSTMLVTAVAAVPVLLGLKSNQDWRSFAPEGFTWAGLIGMMLIAGVAAPFYEEFFFRGMLFRWLRPARGFWVAALVSSLLFGLAHFNPVVSIGTFVLGMLSAGALERTGSLWPCLLIHAVNNSLKIGLLYLALAMHWPLPD